MSVPTHPLLALLDASKNDLKVSLTNYIDFTVENQFGQLRNRIVKMVEDGVIVLGDANAPVLSQANINQANSTDAEDNENVVGNESYSVEPRKAQVSAASFVQPLPANYQNDLSIPSIAPSNMNNLNEHLSGDQISSSPTPLTHPITTEPLIKQEYFEIYGDDMAQAPIKEEYDDDEDECEYMSDYDECEHCVDGICQLNQYNLVRTNDNANNETGVDSEIGLNQDEIKGEPNTSVANDLIPDVIEDSNQSAHNANNLLLSLIKESEQQIHSVQKSTNVTKQNSQNGKSVQPVIELAHQSINTPSTSGLQSSNRKRIPTKLFAYSSGEVKSDIRKSKTESTNKAVKRIKPRNDGENQHKEGDDEEVIDGSNQTIENVCDLSLINESEQQFRRVRKSTKQTTKQDASSTSGGIRSSNRKPIQTKVFDQSTRERNKRESETESTSKAAKRIKHGNVDEVQQEGEDDGNVVENDKRIVVALKLNCTEPNCKTILNSLEMWKQHLWTCHGQIAYKQLEDNVRANQHGQTEHFCTECDSVYKSQRSLIRHWRYFHHIGKFQCSVCAFVANFRCEVMNHQQKYHLEKKLQCTFDGCNKAFRCNYDLEQHQRVHNNEKLYKCAWDNCEDTFNQFETATRHVRIKHFLLPRTIKEQKELNIIDDRDPRDYVQIEN